MTFQILIPTMLGRAHLLRRLLGVLEPQLVPGVSYLTDDGPGTIGAKRQRMLEMAAGDYVAFVDDDDMVSGDYVERVWRAVRAGKDCVGITMHVTIDGRPWNPSPVFRHSLRFAGNPAWQGQERTPHHLCPMRRELALRSRFSDKMWGEDYDFALGVLPHLRTEEWSGDEPVYFYDYVSKKDDPPIPSQVLTAPAG
ncbi:MAG: glycosyltransferase family 2 protein [Burkholderiaceae bacterium]|nr:glycosyltransferase family 2 protein [Burkholderiaceae bacterium]